MKNAIISVVLVTLLLSICWISMLGYHFEIVFPGWHTVTLKPLNSLALILGVIVLSSVLSISLYHFLNNRKQ